VTLCFHVDVKAFRKWKTHSKGTETLVIHLVHVGAGGGETSLCESFLHSK